MSRPHFPGGERAAFRPIRQWPGGVIRQIIDAANGSFHVERSQNTLGYELAPRLSRNPFDHLSCGDEHQVLVTESCSKARKLWQIANAGEYLIRLVGGFVPKKVAAKRIEPDPVGDQITDCQFARHPRVVQLKVRQEFRDLVVPAGFSRRSKLQVLQS